MTVRAAKGVGLAARTKSGFNGPGIRMAVQIRVLGSAQDGGLPQVLCECANCARARSDPSAARTASSVLVSNGSGAWLLDASPDVRHQLARAPHTELRAIALTHAHMGHLAGLLAFGKEGALARIPIWATPSLGELIRRNEPWAQLVRHMPLREVRPLQWIEDRGLRFRFHPVQHRPELSDTVAIEVRAPSSKLLYLPDTDRFDEAVDSAIAELAAGDLLLFDGTFWGRADEVPNRDLAAIPHPPVADSMIGLKPLVERGVRVLFTHLNHSNPLHDPSSAERRRVEAEGFAVATDGWTHEFR